MAELTTDPIAIIAITRSGSAHAAQLHAALPDSDLFLPARWEEASGPRVSAFGGSAREVVAQAWAQYRGLVLFMALGAAIRLLAPHLRDKRVDPAVVVVDDQARFAISALSGHLGGANDLARLVAGLLGAQPVVTTASDAAGTLAVDLVGREFDWQIDEDSEVTRVSAAVVNGDPVGVYQDAGERNWWPAEAALPANLRPVPALADLATGGFAAALIVTDQVLDGVGLPPRVVYRPRSLVVGLGCNRGAPTEEFEEAVLMVLREARLSPASVHSFASIDRRQDEPGLVNFVGGWDRPVRFFSAAELGAVPDLPSPSEMVQRWVGTRGVCEPAALLAAGGSHLLVPKRKLGNVTVAVARIELDNGHWGTDRGTG